MNGLKVLTLWSVKGPEVAKISLSFGACDGKTSSLFKENRNSSSGRANGSVKTCNRWHVVGALSAACQCSHGEAAAASLSMRAQTPEMKEGSPPWDLLGAAEQVLGSVRQLREPQSAKSWGFIYI